jgi:hypothetical protein
MVEPPVKERTGDDDCELSEAVLFFLLEGT